VRALQEASALAMADGFTQSTGKPALVNLHTAAGTGNAMGSLVAAYRANTPLLVTAGQQTREMSIVDPYLNNPNATEFPKQGHDLVVVIGAQVFRYYPYVAGDYLPEGTELIQLTVDPHLASVAPVGDSLTGDVRIGLERLVDLIDTPVGRQAPTPFNRDRAVRTSAPTERLTADEVYSNLATVKPHDSAVVMESTSTMAELAQWLPTTRSGSFFATGSGGIGWGVPGAVGLALGDRERGVERAVVATIGDGSFQYSIQSIWSAAQHRLPIVFVMLRNEAYEVLKSFALLEQTPDVPAPDLPGLDINALATGFGCRTAERIPLTSWPTSSNWRWTPPGRPSSSSTPSPNCHTSADDPADV
jgi:thiamine pyrophosphate-dependent acetolactate synthase large subunit-like protein